MFMEIYLCYTLFCTWHRLILWIVLMSYIHISLMVCYYVCRIESNSLWNVLTVIISHIHIFPYVLSLHILYIQLQTVKCINCIINCNIVPIHISHMFCHYISSIYSYRLQNILNVLSTAIYYSIHSHFPLKPFKYT